MANVPPDIAARRYEVAVQRGNTYPPGGSWPAGPGQVPMVPEATPEGVYFGPPGQMLSTPIGKIFVKSTDVSLNTGWVEK